MSNLHRRDFLYYSAAAGAMLTAGQVARAENSPNKKVVVGLMGLNTRGLSITNKLVNIPGCEIAYICDVDQRNIDKISQIITKAGRPKPEGVTDFRKILDDPKVDALIVATPNHWHGPATIMACAAGKHVYVEKPASHNPREGELMVEAARKHNRVVQHGTQRRSLPGIIQAIDEVHGGSIGRVLFARAWYNNARQSIGHGKVAPVPEWLDYDLWQGPAPRKEFKDNLIHYNWHWFWHWGNAELGNNGIHALDICRWGLQVEAPTRVTSNGGIYHQTDDQETPDTHLVDYDFNGEKGITWEGRSWHRRGFEGSMFGVTFYGDNGSLVFDGTDCILFDPRNRELKRWGSGGGTEQPHLENFFECVRTGARPNADIEDGHKSTLLCHLGNIAFRTGSTVNLDAQGQIVENSAAQALWSREYEPGWEPKV